MFSFTAALFGGCRHYFVRENGRWRCTMCGAVQ
jgi:hypothetical protein